MREIDVETKQNQTNLECDRETGVCKNQCKLGRVLYMAGNKRDASSINNHNIIFKRPNICVEI